MYVFSREIEDWFADYIGKCFEMSTKDHYDSVGLTVNDGNTFIQICPKNADINITGPVVETETENTVNTVN